MPGPRSVRLFAATLSLVVLGAACGEDDTSAASDDAETSATGAVTTSPSTTSPPTAQDEAGESVQVAPDGQCGSPDQTLDSATDAPAAAGTGLESMERTGDPDMFPDFGEVTIAVVAPDGSSTGWCVLLAETGAQRSQGLMEVTDLGGYAGMLFVDDVEKDQSFWMKNTVMPLSIAWFDDEGQFVSVTDMDPCEADPCPSYPSEGPARFSLEVPQGELDGVGIDEDSTLRVGGT